MTVQAGGPFPADALELNRQGRISDDQRAWLRSHPGYSRGNELIRTVGLVAIGVLLLIAAGQSTTRIPAPVAVAAAVAIGAFLVYRMLPGRGPLARDLREGRVETVEGPFAKRTFSGMGRSTSMYYYLDINERSFAVSKAAYDAAPEAGHVRLFVLPNSHRVLNLERLPDPPLPAGTLESPEGVSAALTGVATGMHAHDRTERLEARATLESMKDEMTAAATPPPAGQRDSRPLAQSIVGTWRSAFGETTFAADGTASVSLPGRQAMSGRWSVDPDGRLRVQGPGMDEAADAWVAGETLTIALGGVGMPFHRVAGA